MHHLKLKKRTKKDSGDTYCTDAEADNRASENNESRWKKMEFFSKWTKKGKTKRNKQDRDREEKVIENANKTGSAFENVPGVLKSTCIRLCPRPPDYSVVHLFQLRFPFRF